MDARSRTGVVIGSASIVFSILCLLAMPAFTPGVAVALVVGLVAAAVAAALRARRTALVTLVFALVPVSGLLVMEGLGIGYAAFLPLVMAGIVLAWTVRGYARTT